MNQLYQTDHQAIKIYDEAAFEKMRVAGNLAARTLDFITPHVIPGVSTAKLDSLCHAYILENGASPAPLNYRGFPKSICTSVNHVVCHGIPDLGKILWEGDIINIDVTVILDGWHGDTSRMFYVGKKVPIKAKKLIQTTYESMMAGIETVRPGAKLADIGRAIQQVADEHRYGVVRDFCGHGIGQDFHDQPSVVHFYDPVNENITLQKGMFFTIEPMINAGKAAVKVLNDGWTAVTRDKSLSAQFEHTIGVTEDGFEIFTNSPKGWHAPPYS